MFKRLIALLTALVMCFALCACGSRETPVESPDVTPSESPAPSDNAAAESDLKVDLTQSMFEFASGLKDGDTAATVNGDPIPNELFLYLLSYNCYYLDYNYYQMGSTVDLTNEGVVNYLVSDVKSAITYYAVLRQLCEEKGITMSEEQLAEYQAMIEETINTSYGGDAEQFYRSYGLSPETFLYVYESNYLYNNYAEQELPEPTAEDLEQYVADSGIFGVKHILLMTTAADQKDADGNVTQTAAEYNEAQLALASDLLAQIKSAEDPVAKFDELMKEHSEDGGLTTNPDGYTFSGSDSLVGGFREATLALEVGEISDVVITDYGYHILLRLPVDASNYHDACAAAKMDAMIADAMEEAELVLSDGIAALNVAEFYDRYMAYGLALYNEMNPVQTEEK